ncbi:MAG: hypothetical protein KC619_34395 [Myxococcales bacterium]|nr:hypothetical protein [Myxococcales bacterium]
MKVSPWIPVLLSGLVAATVAGLAMLSRDADDEWDEIAIARAALAEGRAELGRGAREARIATEGPDGTVRAGECALVVMPRDRWTGHTVPTPPRPIEQRASGRFVVEEVCGDDAEVAVDAPWGALLLIGDPEAMDRSVDLSSLEDRYRRELRAENTPAAVLAALFAFVVTAGAAFGFVPRRGDHASVSISTLRRVVLAVDGELRPSLQALLHGTETSPGDLRAARDLLVERVGGIRQVAWQRWRDRRAPIDERWKETEPAPAPSGRSGAGYRDGGDGLVVVELRLRHRCELLPMPRNAGAERIREMLESFVPASDEEIVAIDARLSPTDPTARYDADGLREGWPTLVSIDTVGLRACDACEALHQDERCPACGTEA